MALDKSLQQDFVRLLLERPQIYFDVCLWTFNTKASAGRRNVPFILRPAQIDVVNEIQRAVDGEKDLLINKSRDEGATWLICGMFDLYWRFVPDTVFLVASRKEDLVDKMGSRECLFHRFLYFNKHCPNWMAINAIKTHLHWENPENGSTIEGEATSDNLGAGLRARAAMVDEFGRVDPPIAQNIRETLSDVTDCVIYNSTHFYGRGHPFDKLRRSGKIRVIELPWHKNPVKSAGLYKSPDLNKIELLDDYYQRLYPKVFSESCPPCQPAVPETARLGRRPVAAGIVNRESNHEPRTTNHEPLIYSEIEKSLFLHYPQTDVTFIADGADRLRSVWYDYECGRRDARDIAQNIDMNPVGAGDMFFDPEALERIKQKFVKKPDCEGEIEFETDTIKCKITGVHFKKDGGKKQFCWWGKLIDDSPCCAPGAAGRPDQGHNYIVACDISLGVGSSNSVAGVYDVNLGEKVGMFVSADLPPESFADQTLAICYWTGGVSRRPFLIWESNGPGGSFGKRIRNYGYDFVYRTRDERNIKRKKTFRVGWYSSRETKYDLLLELRIALAMGLGKESRHKRLVIHDSQTVNEAEDYIFFENGELGPSGWLEDSKGARSAHGDRVIPDALYVLALSEQPKAAAKVILALGANSFGRRRETFVREKERGKERSPWIFE